MAAPPLTPPPPPRTAAMGKRVYDVAVLGPDLGGAATAALLSRRGLRVLLAPMGTPAAVRESEGFLFPVSFPLLPPLRQLSGAVPAFEELGLLAELQRQIAPATCAFQLLGDTLRLSLPLDAARRRAELRRELPEREAQQAEAELESLDVLGRPWDPLVATPPPLPARGFLERRKLQKMLPPAPTLPSGLVGEALAALAPLAASSLGDGAPEATAREAAALLRAPTRAWGGEAFLAELLRRKAQEAGAHLFPDRVANLRLDKKSAAFELGGSEVTVSTVVIACGGEAVAALCESGTRSERKLAEEARIPVARKIALAHFVVRPEGLPAGLEEASLLLGSAEGPLALCVLPARRVRGDSAGERLLVAARPVPAEQGDASPVLASARAALEPILPFFERHIVHQAADVDLLVPHLLFAPRADGEALGLRPQSAAHERVLFASASVYPGFGLEGSFLAARACADHASAVTGRKEISAT